AIVLCLSGYIGTKHKAVYFLLFLETILAGGMFLRIYSQLIGAVLLPEYGSGIIAAAMLLTVLYGCMRGKIAGRRLALLSVPLLLVCAALCLVPAANDMDIKNVRILPERLSKAVKDSVFAGFLLVFPLVSLYGEKRKDTKNKAAFAAVWLAAVSAAFIWLSRFDYAAKRPVLDLMYAGGGASSFIRRQEGLILGIITLSAYFMLKNMLECAANSLGGGQTKTGGFALCAVLMFVCGLVPKTAETAEYWFKFAVTAGGTVFLLILPLAALSGGERRTQEK
ncbi:MAG: hypothetical protein IJR59_00555, partial [Firmicutes bacterium]|nr:hypothetical protein [Bacillota bacterium]